MTIEPGTLGPRLRALRLERGLRLEDLAARSGVSRSMISKVERGESSPTTALLSRLADGLGLGVTALIGPAGAPAELVVLRRRQQHVLADPAGGFERRSLMPSFDGATIDFVLNTLEEGAETGSFGPHPPAVAETVFVVEGVLRARIGGQEVLLDAGDSLFFRADRDHSFANAGMGPARYCLLVDRSRLG